MKYMLIIIGNTSKNLSLYARMLNRGRQERQLQTAS